MTRVSLALLGVVSGLAPGAVAGWLGAPPVVAIALVAVGVVGLAVRGTVVHVRLGADSVVVRNLWRTRTVPVDAIATVTLLRHAGTLKASTPALAVRGRRLRIPMHAASMWGHWWTGETTLADLRIATALVSWATQHHLNVDPALVAWSSPPR